MYRSLKKMLVWWLCRFPSDLSSPCERLTVRCAFSRQRLPVWPFCQQHSRPIPGVPTVNETKLNNIKRHGHHYISKFVMCNALILFHFFGFVLIHQIIKVYLKLGAWLEDLCARRSLSILAQLWLTSTPPASWSIPQILTNTSVVTFSGLGESWPIGRHTEKLAKWKFTEKQCTHRTLSIRKTAYMCI